MDLRSKLQTEYMQAKARLEALEHFPDLEEYRDIWNGIRLISPTVNGIASKFEVRNQCDCCSGANVYVMPYIELECGIRIYTSPPLISVAKRWQGGIIAAEDWETKVQLNTDLIEKIWNYIEYREDNDEETELLGQRFDNEPE